MLNSAPIAKLVKLCIELAAKEARTRMNYENPQYAFLIFEKFIMIFSVSTENTYLSLVDGETMSYPQKEILKMKILLLNNRFILSHIKTNLFGTCKSNKVRHTSIKDETKLTLIHNISHFKIISKNYFRNNIY